MFKRIIAVAMAVVMVTTGVNMTAFAAESKTTLTVQQETIENTSDIVAEGSVGTPEVGGANSVGTVLANALNEEQQAQNSGNGNSIMAVEMDGKKATVTFATTNPATLVVGIYDNEGRKLLAAGTKEVSTDVHETEVIIDTETMPTYYYVKAFLVDSDSLKPVCKVYQNPNYTREMQEFFAKTTDDFDQERVLKLDEDKTNNFVVYAEGVELITEQPGVNTLVSEDEETLKYEFESIDSNLSNLDAGDIFVYGEEDPLIVKVGNITIDGTTATITGVAPEVEEVFEFVKIDSSCAIVVPESAEDDGVRSLGVSGGVGDWDIELEDELKLSKELAENHFKKTFKNGSEAKIDFKARPGVIVKFYYSNFTHVYAEVKISLECEINASISGGVEAEDLYVGMIPLATAFGILVDIPIYLVFESEGEVSVAVSFSTKLGVSFDSDKGMELIEPISESKLEYRTEGSVFIGVKAGLECSVIEILEGQVDVAYGIEGKASYSNKGNLTNEVTDEKHACKVCLDGDVNNKIVIGGEFKLFKKKVAKKDFAEIVLKMGDFYFSLDNSEFGWGECPYKEYRMLLQFINGMGQPVAGVTLNDGMVSDAGGTISIFGKPNLYAWDATKEGYDEVHIFIELVDAPVHEVINMDYVAVEEDDYLEDNEDEGNQGENDSEQENDGNISIRDVQNIMIGSTCGYVTEDGNLYMWGDNSYGQVGDGTTTDCLTPTKILSNVISVGKYMSTYSAITEDGSLYMWGYNTDGQVGNGTKESCLTPVKVLDDVVSVEGDGYTSAAVTEDGSLYAWGYNGSGQVGAGGTGNYLKPTKVLDNVALLKTGSSSSALTKDGSLYMWGDNSYGQVGNGTTTDCLKPAKILDDVVSMECVSFVSTAITKDGSLYTWGLNNSGQVGNGTAENCLIPTKILDKVVSVLQEGSSSATITEDGSLYTWGSSPKGGIGNGSTEVCLKPTKILDDVVSLKYDDQSGAALTKDGSLYTWGKNEWGQVGDGTKNNCLIPTKVLDNVASIEKSSHTSAAITKDGSLYMWGYNRYGAIGDGTKTHCLEPFKVLDNAIFVCCTSSDTTAITKSGSLYRWGANSNGQIGNGTTEACLTPVKVLDEIVWTAPYGAPAAVAKDGSLYRWGSNSAGQVGNGTTVDSLTPTKVIFGSSAGTVNLTEHIISYESMSLNAMTYAENVDGTNDGNDGSGDGDDVATATFKGKMPNETYNFYVLKNRSGRGDATADNILYMDQVVADTEGKVEVTYIPREKHADAKIFLSGRLGKFNMTDAVVNANDLLYTGEELFAEATVTYNGKELTEGIDYNVCGDFCATESGEYELIIRGKGEYTGEQRVTYHIRRYSLDVYGVIFDSNGGSAVKTQEVEKGQPAVEPEVPTRENHHFKGWYLNGEPYDFATPVTGHLTLVAQWEEYSKLEAPKASIPSGSRVNVGKEVTLSAAANATIYYTIDGTVPTKESAVYTKPIVIEQDMTIKAFTAADGYYDSEVAVFTYTAAENGDSFDTVNPEDVPAEGIPEGIWVGKIADQTYTGKAIKPTVRVYDGTRRLVVGRDYTISYKNNVKAQTDLTAKKAPMAVIKGKGNYTKMLTVAFKILPIDLNADSIIADDITVAYNKKVQKKSPTVYYGSKKLSKKDVKVEFVDTSANAYQELGIYKVKLTGQGNFDGERMINLIVTDKIPMSSVKVAKVEEQTYQNGSAIEPKFEISYNKADLVAGTDYDVTYINNQKIGTATAILTGKGDYVGIKRVTFKIAGTDIKRVKVEGLKDQQYSGAAITQELVLTYNDAKLGENDYSVKYSNNVNVGKATVTITGKGAFSGTVKKTFKIAAYDLKADTDKAVAEIAQNFEVLYAKGGSKPVVDVVYKGKTLTVGKDYTISYKNNAAVTAEGTMKLPTFTIKGKGNFKGTLEGTFRIVTKALNDANEPVTITVSDIVHTDKAGKYISKPVLMDSNGKALKAGMDYAKDVQYMLKDGTVLDKTSVVPMGTEVVVTVAGTGNYSGTLQATYRVTELDFKKVKATADAQVYTGEAIVLDSEDIKVTLGGVALIYGKDYEIVEGSYKNNIRKGTASVTVKGIGSYGGSKTVKFKIVAKELKK